MTITTKPTALTGWARNTVEETTTIGGSPVLVTNKTEPTEAIKDSGFLARQRAIRNYFNWLFDNLYSWVDNFDSRSSQVGSVHIFATPVLPAVRTIGDMATEFGGTWSKTTDTIGGVACDVFTRTA